MMPRIGQPNRDDESESLDDAGAFADFESGFARSRKGNLWRHFDGKTIVVFHREGDDRFAYSISDEDGPTFSRRAYPSVAEAMKALARELGVIG